MDASAKIPATECGCLPPTMEILICVYRCCQQCGDQCEWLLWEEGHPATPAGQHPLTAATFAKFTRDSPLDAAFATSLRRAYYAAISLMDDAIGRTMAVLEELELEQDTVVIFHAGECCRPRMCRNR